MKKIIKRSLPDVIRDMRQEMGTLALNIRAGNIGSVASTRTDRVVIIGALMAALFIGFTQAAYASDLIDTATQFATTYFSKIVTFSTIAAVFLTACCVIWMMLSPTSRGAQGPMDWVKRIWIAWVILNGMTGLVAIAKTFVNSNTDINVVAGS